MASSMIHIVVANEINKILKRDQAKLLIGTIAPDLSQRLGLPKREGHFLYPNSDAIPDMEKFLSKYKNYLKDDFVLGYYIHLYTDYLWFKYFIPEIKDKNMIKKLDGTIVPLKGNMLAQYIYNDYTNMNITLIDEYNLDLKIFYNPIPPIDNIIEEIPMDKLKVIVDAAGTIVENTKVHKDMVFDIGNVKQFVKTSTKLILSEIEKLNI